MADKFIPLAEQVRLSDDLGEWAIGTACRQLAAWRLMGHGELEIAINVSPLPMRERRDSHE